MFGPLRQLFFFSKVQAISMPRVGKVISMPLAGQVFSAKYRVFQIPAHILVLDE